MLQEMQRDFGMIGALGHSRPVIIHSIGKDENSRVTMICFVPRTEIRASVVSGESAGRVHQN